MAGLFNLQASARTPDQELLAQFLRDKDERAFATLMERHGAMVLGVCRRILKNAQDAEDACQAVFLVLARKADTIRQGSVASWLHGVAWNVANKLYTSRRRRLRRETIAAAEKPTAVESEEMTWREVQRVVDEELGRLAEKYRGPLVLCYLEGRTQDEAARELGFSLSTLRGRLERGRELLRSRLTRRGIIGASSLVFASLLPNLASASPQTALVSATATASVPLATGGPIPADISPPVAALTRDALQTSMWPKLVVVAALVACATIGTLMVLALNSWPTGADDAAPPARPAWTDMQRLEVPDGHLWCVAYSPDGKWIAAGSGKFKKEGEFPDAGELRVWETKTHKVLFSRPTPRSVRCIAYAPGGKIMATAEHDGAVRLYDASTGNILQEMRTRIQVDSVSFSADGKTLASSGWDARVKLWDPSTGAEIRSLEGHESQVFNVAFGGPEGALASGGVDQVVRLWEPATGKMLRALPGHAGVVHWLAFSPTNPGQLASASWDKTVRLWDATTGKPTAILHGHAESVLAVAFSPDGKTLASAAARRTSKELPGEIILWDLTEKKPRVRLQRPDRVFGLAFSPDGGTLAVAGWNGAVTLLKQDTNQVAAEQDGAQPKLVALWEQPVEGPEPKKEYNADYRPSLKEGKLPAGLVFFGPDAADCVKFKPEGLHLTLPLGFPRQRPGTGVITDFGVKGDFEITVCFEVLQEPSPGNVRDLRLVVVPDEAPIAEVWHKSTQNRASLCREIGVGKRAGQFLANATSWHPDVPKDQWGNDIFTNVEQHSNKRMPAPSRTGRLRMARREANLYYYVSDGDQEFALIHKSNFGTKNLKNVRVLGTTGGPPASLEVRVTDLHVRADAFVTPGAAMPSAPRAGDPPPARRSWVLLAVVGAAPVVFLVVAAGVWMAKRKRSPGKSATIVFTCRGCGKRLKVRANRTGAKMKCPDCGKSVIVPESQPSAPEESS